MLPSPELTVGKLLSLGAAEGKDPRRALDRRSGKDGKAQGKRGTDDNQP